MRPVRTRWKTWPARSSAERPRQIGRGGDQLGKRGGGGVADGGGGDGEGAELLLAVSGGVRERRGTGRRRRRDEWRRRSLDLGLERWRRGFVVAEVWRRRGFVVAEVERRRKAAPAAVDDMVPVVAGDRDVGARRQWVVGEAMGNGRSADGVVVGRRSLRWALCHDKTAPGLD